MFKRFSTNYMAMLLLLDAVIIQVALRLGMQLRFYLPIGKAVWPPSQWENFPMLALHGVVAVLWMVAFLFHSIYTPRHIIHWYEEFQRILVAHTMAALALAGVLYFANIELLRLAYLYFSVIALGGMLSYRVGLRTWHRLHRQDSHSTARILVAGAGKVGQDLVAELQQQHWPGIEFVGFLDDAVEKQQTFVEGLPVLGRLDDIVEVVKDRKVDEVFIALPLRAHIRLANLVALLHTMPVRVRVVPDYFELAFFGATVENLGGIPLIGLRDPAIEGFQRLVKRLIDIVLSALGLLLLSPVLLITAIAIKLEDGGPIFYWAERVGENGQLFRMLKFRSMIVDAEKLQAQVACVDDDGQTIYKIKDDPRVTRVGRFIRHTSIDELPQLWNVLKGEMSLVGPRPELPWLVENYEPWQRKRFAVPQGITGWWQINGRSDKPMYLHSEDDLFYIQNYSLWLDFQILFRTVFVVLRGKGAY